MGGGGKTLRLEQSGQSLAEFLLVLFDAHQVIPSALEEHGFGRLGLGMSRVGQGEFGVEVEFSQQRARHGNLVGAFGHDQGAQPAALSVDRFRSARPLVSLARGIGSSSLFS